jgi:hypothetical protein
VEVLPRQRQVQHRHRLATLSFGRQFGKNPNVGEDDENDEDTISMTTK